MKFYEWILTIVCVSLIYVGIALWDKRPGLAVGVFLIVAVLFSGYMYFVKTLPMKLIKQIFVDTVTANDFQLVNDKSIRRDVSSEIKRFPGFDDLFFSLDSLYSFEQGQMYCFAGEYSISGYGCNRGYFLLIDLTQTGFLPVSLTRLVDQMDKLNEDSERVLANLPDEMIKLVRTFPYDLHCMDSKWLFDFDTRNLNKRNFQDSFNKAFGVFKTGI